MKLLRLFRRGPKLPELSGHVINMWEHKTWGDNLFWMDTPYKREGGRWRLGTHAVRLPRVGDEIRCKMQSGNIGRWVVTEVEYMRDPRDKRDS